MISWPGTVINTATSQIDATEKRIQSLQDNLNSILSVSSSSIPVRKLANICGKIISLGNCVGNVSRLMTRNLFAVVNSALSWNSYVLLSPESLTKLIFWKSNIASLSGIPIWPNRNKPSKIIYSDASGSACISFIEFDELVRFREIAKFYVQGAACCFSCY